MIEQQTVDGRQESARQRVGDAERERVVGLLGEHVGAGRLELAEFEERIGSVYAARTRGELDVLLADLPRARPVGGDPRRGHRIALTAAWAPWLASTVICLMIWAMVSIVQGAPDHFWPFWVFGPWGAMLLLGTLTGSRGTGDGP